MRIFVASLALLFLLLGLWLISTGFIHTGPPVTNMGSQIANAPQATAGPVALGVALLAGGGLLFVMLLRRR